MSDPKYWIGVAARDHIDRGVAEGFCMFAHGKHAAVLKLSPGDYFIYYAPMTGMGTGETVRAFVAIGTILEGAPQPSEMTTGTGWRRAARYLPSHPANIYPLLDRLSFIRDRAHWGMAFRRSLFSAEKTDFALIAAAMGVSLPEITI